MISSIRFSRFAAMAWCIVPSGAAFAAAQPPSQPPETVVVYEKVPVEEPIGLHDASGSVASGGGFSMVVFAVDLCGGEVKGDGYSFTMSATATLVDGGACRGDFDHNGSTGMDDLYGFLKAYESGGVEADFDGRGGPSSQDLYDYLGAWLSGCP